MAITSGDIDFYLSGGASNSDIKDSLGGARSTTTQITDASLHNLFDIVNSTEASAGDTEYRCFYVENAHETLTLQSPVIWMVTLPTGSDVTIEIGIGTSGVNGTEQTVADENTAPTSITWETGQGSGNSLSFPADLPALQHMAIWVKRVVGSSSSADDLNSVVIRVQGDTAE